MGVVAQLTQIGMAQRWQGPQTPVWPQVEALTLSICVVFGGKMDHGCQHRPWPWWDHRPRHGPYLEPRLRHHHSPEWQHRQLRSFMTSEAARLLETKIATGGQPDPRHPCGLWCQIWIMDISTDPGCGRTMDPDMSLGRRPDPNTTLALGDKQATHISLFLTTSFLQFCLFPQHVNHSASLSLPSHHHICAHHNGMYEPGAFSKPRPRGPRMACGCCWPV